MLHAVRGADARADLLGHVRAVARAVQEGVLRGSLLKDGKHLDQIMWSIVSQDWFQSKAVWETTVQ